VNLANLDIIAAEIDSQIPICSPFRSALRLIGVGAGSFWYFDFERKRSQIPCLLPHGLQSLFSFDFAEPSLQELPTAKQKKIYKPLKLVYREPTDREVME